MNQNNFQTILPNTFILPKNEPLEDPSGLQESAENSIEPQEKNKLAAFELKTIVEFHKKLGNKWTQIARQMKNTNERIIKNKFFIFLRSVARRIASRSLKVQEIDCVEQLHNFLYFITLLKESTTPPSRKPGKRGGAMKKDVYIRKVAKKYKLQYLILESIQNQIIKMLLKLSDITTPLQPSEENDSNPDTPKPQEISTENYKSEVDPKLPGMNIFMQRSTNSMIIPQAPTHMKYPRYFIAPYGYPILNVMPKIPVGYQTGMQSFPYSQRGGYLIEGTYPRFVASNYGY